MTLAPATRLGPYEIVTPLGAGGMGEVYRAKDGRLGREVAIKVLPAEVASDPERLRRFEQEAKAVSALNHPNSLTVFDLGDQEGTPFLVLDLFRVSWPSCGRGSEKVPVPFPTCVFARKKRNGPWCTNTPW